MVSSTDIVLVRNLLKVYKGGTRAVDGIDFAVQPGEFFGLLGPNGAGKTTTIKILSTLLKKTSGEVRVAGYDIDRDPLSVRKSIGFAMQSVGLDDLSTGRDFLMLQGLLYGLSAAEARSRVEELLDLVGLASVAKRKVGTYSGGMRRRIDLVAALIHRPPLLLLDEPTTGLDPQSRLAIWDYLAHLNEQGVTILLTTQMMEEADRLCRRIAIIDRGLIVAEGSPDALKADIGGDVIHVTVASKDEALTDGMLEKARSLVGSRSYVREATISGDGLTLKTADSSAAVPDLIRVLDENQISATSISVDSPTLDDVFLLHTGRSIRAEETSGGESDLAVRSMLGLGRRE
ncbi:MAG: ATP-binding cassette domain-containing protein [Chloroflexi bacterium]|nr:ATP-binding cassette domain-containing protein [Chloroflexota bacterium]